jgi:hypothetical protein
MFKLAWIEDTVNLVDLWMREYEEAIENVVYFTYRSFQRL